MSQQTQIGRVGEALPAFLARFPDVASLATATVGDVLRAWGALGYPRRALALREAAREMVARHDARVPPDVSALQRLPGVGPYTARAVASTAFGIPVTALDVNARRVLVRVLGRSDGAAPAGRAFQAVADALAPADHAADWNHALMDLGATVCRPAPHHAACPLATMCAWLRDHPSTGVDTPTGTKRGRARAHGTSVAFRDTNHQFVRGRVLANLRDAPPASWRSIDPEGLSVEPERLQRALAELHREGLIEIDDVGRVRLPIA